MARLTPDTLNYNSKLHSKETLGAKDQAEPFWDNMGYQRSFQKVHPVYVLLFQDCMMAVLSSPVFSHLMRLRRSLCVYNFLELICPGIG